MIAKFVILCVVLCMVVPSNVRAEVTVQNSAYQDVLVSFSSNLQPENAKDLVDRTKELIKNVSQLLRHSIGISIGKIIFRLPDSWNTSSWDPQPILSHQLESVALDSDTSDITVSDKEDSAFGSNPFTLQYAGCGNSGKPILLTSNFLTEDSDYHFPKDKLVAREWLKYRYGIFDENGFLGDPLYPSIYAIPGGPDGLRVTDCTNEDVQYQFRDERDTNCTLETGDTSDCWSDVQIEDANITSSLMYWHKDLTKMEDVCGKEHKHNSIHPNKQNILCAGQSIWDILKLSPDFISAETTEAETVAYNENPEFVLIQDTKPRTAIVLEDSNNLKDQKNAILLAVNRLFYDMRNGDQFALYTYNEEINDEYKLSVLEETRQLPAGIANFYSENVETSPVAACEHALNEMLESNGQERGQVIIIAGSELSDQYRKELLEKFSDTPICLSVVTFINSAQETPIVVTPTLLSDSDLESCHKHWKLQGGEQNNVDSFRDLYEALLDSVSKQPPAVEQTSRVEYTGIISQTVDIKIPSDPLADKITLWLSSNTLINTKDIQCDNWIDFNKGISSGTIVSFVFEPPESEGSCKLKYAGSGDALAQVQVTTSPENELNAEIWINNPTVNESLSQAPVLIYAHLTLGGNPIEDASVFATVIGPKKTTLMENRALYDDGSGGPDLTKGDGVYSGYFIEFQGLGTYTVTVTMTNEGDAKAGKNGSSPCCGSFVKSTKEAIPPFNRIFSSKFDIVAPKPEAGFQPSRILDLKALQTAPLTLQWTAPGGQMDRGKAKSYTIKVFTNVEDAMGKFNEVGLQLDTTSLTPENYGHLENITVDVNYKVETSLNYVVVCSSNANDVHSDVSNVVEIFVEHTKPPIPTPEPNNKSRTDNKTLITVVSVLGAVIITSILIYSIAYCVSRRRKPKAKTDAKSQNVETGGGHDNAAFGVNSMSAEVILKHHNEVLEAKNLHKNPPIFTEASIESTSNGPQVSAEVNEEMPEYSQVKKADPSTQEDMTRTPKRMTRV